MLRQGPYCIDACPDKRSTLSLKNCPTQNCTNFSVVLVIMCFVFYLDKKNEMVNRVAFWPPSKSRFG